MTNEQKSGARTALALLLAINLFNYIDRYVLASLLPTLKHQFLAGDPNQNGKAGLWTTAFLISYMCTAPIFGWLADRFSRWILIGISVAIWSLASGWSGLATSFAVLLCTRLFVGIGEAGYGPAAPTIIADLYPLKTRGRVLAWFYVASRWEARWATPLAERSRIFWAGDGLSIWSFRRGCCWRLVVFLCASRGRQLSRAIAFGRPFAITVIYSAFLPTFLIQRR